MVMITTAGRESAPAAFRYHVECITKLLPVKGVVPSMTEAEVRYEIGIQTVVDYMQETSAKSGDTTFNETFIYQLSEHFKLPVFDYATPMSHIMYCAGVIYAIDMTARYYQRELTGD